MDQSNVFASFEHDGRCYMVSNNTANWMDARASCQSLGENFDLASIMSAVENMFVSYALYSLDLENPNYVAPAWIGLNTIILEGNLSWSDGLPPGFGSQYDKFPWTSQTKYRLNDRVSNTEDIKFQAIDH